MSTSYTLKSSLKHILGIDFGKAKIGLAIADSETRMAFGYGTLKNDKNLLQKLEEIIEKEGIEKVIIGILSDPTARPKRNADGPQSLGNSVSKLAGIEVEYQEEMFSTLEAQRNLKEKGMKKIQRFDDQEAARIILQSWLDRPRNM
jgi:putative holliday junction resolvase